MTTVQRGCRPKKATSSSRRSLRLSWTLLAASTPWRWKVDLAVSIAIMLVLIAGGSLDAGPDDRTLAHRCRWGPSTPAARGPILPDAGSLPFHRRPAEAVARGPAAADAGPGLGRRYSSQYAPATSTAP